jgi:hypothetical protein
MRAVLPTRPAAWPVGLLAAALGCGGASAPRAVATVLVNGSVHEREWDDAPVVTEQSDVELRVKRSGDWVYLVVMLHGPRHSGLDLYLASGSTVRMFHVSSALGQRKLGKDGTWSELAWGKNRLWTANVVGLIMDGEKMSLLPPTAFEFQIHRSLLPGKPWQARLHLKRPEVIVPPDTQADAPENWFIVP